MYDKIDYLRVNSSNETNQFLLRPDKIPEEIGRYMSDRDRRDINKIPEEKKIFSDDFYQMLPYFDLPRPAKDVVVINKDFLTPFFQKLARRKEENHKKEVVEMTKNRETQSDFNQRKIREVSLKLHLGSKEQVQTQDYHPVTNKSSLMLSNLQSVSLS